jgi:hypothetical protein
MRGLRPWQSVWVLLCRKVATAIPCRMLQFGGSGVIEVSRAWALPYHAAALLRSTIIIIRVTQRLYNRRLISYKATHYFFRVAKMLEQQTDRLATREELVRLNRGSLSISDCE